MQRQAQDGGVIALDPVEQVNAEPFHLITADAQERLLARCVEINGQGRDRPRRAWRVAPRRGTT